MQKDLKDIPLSESNVSLKLADIQKRCEQLLAEPDAMGELTLAENAPNPDNNNPYNRG